MSIARFLITPKINLTLTFIFLFTTIFPSYAQQEKRKINIGLLDLEGRGISIAEAGTISDRLRTELVKTDVFNVLERSEMEAITEEMGFQMSGCTSTECVVEIGRILNLEVMLAGSIGKVGQTYTADVRAFNVATSKITKTVSRNYKGELDGLLDIVSQVAKEFAGQDLDEGSGFWWWATGILLAAAGAAGYYYYYYMSPDKNDTETLTTNLPDPGGRP